MKKALFLFFILSVFFLASCAGIDASLIKNDLSSEYFTIAEGYAEISKYEKAIIFYRKASLKKEYANAANYGLGRMYSLSGKWQDACDVFNKLYSQDKQNILMSNAYAYALASNGQIEEAESIYISVWNKNREDPSAAKNYAGMLIVSGKYAEASELLVQLKEKYADTEEVKGFEELEKKLLEVMTPKELETQHESPTFVPTTYTEKVVENSIKTAKTPGQ